MATLEENIAQAIADFDSIEDAIKSKGVDVPEGTDTSEYGKLIKRIRTGDGGGAGVLMVTIDEDDNVSHTNAQIYEHYQNGGMVVADYWGDVFVLINADENYAYFSRATDDPAIYVLCLADGGVDHYDEYYLVAGDALWELGERVGDIDAALDTIIAIQKELIGVTLITFTIDGVAFNAEQGMNWMEWCASEYNTDGWNTAGVDGFVVRARDGWNLMLQEGYKVQVGGDVAIDGAVYVLD